MPFIIGIDDFEIQIVGNFFQLLSRWCRAVAVSGILECIELAYGVGSKELPHRRCLALPSTSPFDCAPTF